MLNVSAASFFTYLARQVDTSNLFGIKYFIFYFVVISSSYIAGALLPIVNPVIGNVVGNVLVIVAYFILLAGLISRQGQSGNRRTWVIMSTFVSMYIALEIASHAIDIGPSNSVVSRTSTLLMVMGVVLWGYRFVVIDKSNVLFGEKILKLSLIIHFFAGLLTLTLAYVVVDPLLYLIVIMIILCFNTILMTGSLMSLILSDEIQKNYALSTRDSLTNLYNRGYFFERLETLIEHQNRHDRTLSIVIMDLDNFKTINDRFGHVFGDGMLTSFSKVLSGNSRESDIIARFGGEEFVAALPDADYDSALIWAQRILKQTNEIQVNNNEYLGVSIGISTLKTGDVAQNRAEKLLDEADKNLYKAKVAGRNRIL
ncbi:diguanylate cyclase [Reinekea forsetii]|nr:diguanylate cyclase [Reinekea forsetii]